MVFKTWDTGTYVAPEPKRISTPQTYQAGSLVGLVGTSYRGRASRDGTKEHMENLYRIDGDLLAYNASAGRLLVRYEKNERDFDRYILLPFTKGVTERTTGRTLMILGSSAHHGDAMQNQFEGVLWSNDEKKYGDSIRWINVGDMKNGFIGLDFNPSAQQDDGVATSIEDIKFLAKTLIDYEFDPVKKLYLLKPPYIVESDKGKELRRRGYETIRDYASKK